MRRWWKKRKVELVVSAVIVAVCVGYGAWFVHDHNVVVTAFNIGQGDATLIRSGTREVLIDGGPSPLVQQKLGAAMPFFDRTIEYVILTHPHRDHYFGLLSVFANYRVEQFWVSGLESRDSDYQELMARAQRAGANIVVVKQGDQILLRDDARLVVLAAKQDLPESAQSQDMDPNEVSIVSRLDVREQDKWIAKLLCMGDAPASVEALLLQKKLVGPTPYLKVGHHGSKYSSSEQFLDVVRPRMAIISVGKNTYGHPAPRMLSRLRVRGITIWRTDKNGDAVLRL